MSEVQMYVATSLTFIWNFLTFNACLPSQALLVNRLTVITLFAHGVNKLKAIATIVTEHL